MINKPIIYKFFIDLTNHRKKINRAIRLSPKFLNTEITNETFQQSEKNLFRHILKNSASMHENSSSQFFRSNTGIQSGPNSFDN